MSRGVLVRVSRRRRRLQKRGRFWPRVRTAFLFVVAIGVLCVVGLFASFSYSYYAFAEDLPDLDDYQSAELAQTSTVYDSEGNVVQELSGVQNRFVVDLGDVDPTLQDAVVAIEDHRFREHRGVDFEAIARAARRNIETLSIQEGGSTITQQLVKNTYIAQEQRSVPSFQRKINEAALAWQYEKDHSKDEILEQYLNTVYFGSNAYGAEAAARTYFDKSAKDLTLPESAMLAGIINLPGAYDPFTDPESAKARRDVVLDSMLQYGLIDKEQHDEAVATDLNLSRGRVEPQNDNEYFLNAVRTELAREYGDETVYEGGLKIYTTLDPTLQEQANSAVDSIVDPESGDPSASLVSVDPQTGAVRAMVGGSNFEEVKFNLATQSKRQPGSAFKPFVLAEMVRQGFSPQSIYNSHDLQIPQPDNPDEPYYEVSNYGNIVRGPISVAEATAQSDNTVFVQLAMDLGLQNVADMAHELGITSDIEPYPSTAIGGLGEGVNPLDMASAYSTFANSGTHMEPFLVNRVTKEENGEEKVIEEHKLSGNEVLTRDQAAVVTDVLRGVVEHGTASQFHNLDAEIGHPSAGKTGTTEEFADAWFVGYIPQLTTSVWVGYPGDRTPMVNINGLSEINGENYPLDIWSAYMQTVAPYYEVQQFDTPNPNLDLEVRNGEGVVEETTTEDTTEETTSGETTGGFDPGGFDFDGSDEPTTFQTPPENNLFGTQTQPENRPQGRPQRATPRQQPAQQPAAQQPRRQQRFSQQPSQQPSQRQSGTQAAPQAAPRDDNSFFGGGFPLN